MAYRLEPFANTGLDHALLQLLIEEHGSRALPRLRKLWSYYRNPAQPSVLASAAGSVTSVRPRLAQEAGLPPRLTGAPDALADDRGARPEIVIENDIAWRVQAMVDFMFGKPVSILSTARDDARRRLIERVLDAVWEASGGIALLQDAALLGHVYGHVDLLLRVESRDTSALRRLRATGAGSPPPDAAAGAAASPESIEDLIVQAAREMLRIEVVEPTRGIPLLNAADYRRIDAYIIHLERELNAIDRSASAIARGAQLVSRLYRGEPAPVHRRKRASFTEILSATHRQLYDDGQLVHEEPLAWTGGQLPVVHIQNISQPFRYEGQGEVEPLIPLQDELNTRLSDRASRVTLQSFKMYLMKGMGAPGPIRIAPGMVWQTDNPDASVHAFGGDADSPSEDAHIQEIREALDKQSGVPPLASGVVRARIGNLTSANALRITLMGVLSKTARKRIAYGRGITRLCELALTALDHLGILPTDQVDRQVKLSWPDPLPEDLQEQAAAARVKAELGLPPERILADLGYAATDAGVT